MSRDPSDIPPPPSGDFLTAEQILAFSKQRSEEIRYDSEGVNPCAYCRNLTAMRAYTDLKARRSWPVCCLRDECMEKWEPVPMVDPT